jgi:hypothetical protein
MVSAALVIDGRAMADFRVHRDLVHGAVVVPHHQGHFDAITDFQRAGEPGQRKVIAAAPRAERSETRRASSERAPRSIAPSLLVRFM